MRHLTDGTLRRMVDEPLAISARVRDHYSACPRCRSKFEEIDSNARETARLLSTSSDVQVDPRPALSQLHRRITVDRLEPGPRWQTWLEDTFRRRARRFRKLVGGASLAAVVVGALFLTPAGSLAQNFVDVFQPKQIAPLTISTNDLSGLPDLSRFGTLHLIGHLFPRKLSDQTVPNAAAAASASQMNVLTPASLPAGVPSSVTYDLLPGSSASFTFRAAKARQAAAATGKPLPRMPAGLDGSTLQVTTGMAVVAVYGNAAGDALPALVVGQMKAPTISITRVSVKVMENYILSLPGVTPRLASAIRSIGDPTKTLPLPIPIDLAQAQTVQVQGVQATAVGDATGVGSVVVWEKNGIIYGVGGTQPEDQILAVANSLR
jgi:hypothetical protein